LAGRQPFEIKGFPRMPVKKADYVNPYKSTTYARYPFCSVAVSFCDCSLQCSIIFVHKSLALAVFFVLGNKKRLM
jgi:hypothetical protein